MEIHTVQDAPVIHPTMAEMVNFAELTARASDMAMRYGAVLIEPPAEWRPPPMRMRPSSRFFVRTQVLPEAPFVDPDFIHNLSTSQHEAKRRKRPSHNHDQKSFTTAPPTHPMESNLSRNPMPISKPSSSSSTGIEKTPDTAHPAKNSVEPEHDAGRVFDQKERTSIANLNNERKEFPAPCAQTCRLAGGGNELQRLTAVANKNDFKLEQIDEPKVIEVENIIEQGCVGLQDSSIRKPVRASRKRKSPNSSMLVFNQDNQGRLTKPITFSYSETPISLHSYKKRAQVNIDDLHRKLCVDKEWCSEIDETDGKWKNDVKRLEEIFWHSMKKGIDGKPICVDYGVDVEAEGAFDTQDMSYAEWYGSREKQAIANSRNASKKDPHVFHHPAERNCPVASRHVGNVNDDSLLRHLPNMPGINHSMYYVGQLFTRFCWHTEDGFLNSISYLHEGSAEKIWYAIPPQHAAKFEEYATANVFSPSLVEEQVSGPALLMNKTTIFDPQDIVRHGIPVYRVTHRPRTIVVTAPRAYHAGFNCGFNIAEAVNFAHPTWFPLGREASKLARSVLKPLCIPWEYLLYHEARAMQALLLPHVRTGEISERVRAQAAIVARELERIMSEGERTISECAKEQNLRIKMITDINVVVKSCQVGPEYGPGAGIVCTLCGHACHFYAEVCGCCEGGEEARCPDHFGSSALCDKKGHSSVLVRRHDPVMLLDLLDDLEEIGGVETNAEERLKRFKGFLRPWQTPLQKSGLCLRIDLLRAMSRESPKTKRKKDGTSRERKKRSRLRDAKHVHFKADKYAQDVT